MGDWITLTTRLVFWKWAAIGLLVAVFLTWAQARAVDGVAGMLQVGEASALRPLIEDQLGEVPLAPGRGHDGQIFYSIGLDLNGNEVGPLLDHAAYRYRRVLLPLFASGFGLLEGWPLLWGQVVVCVLSMSMATAIVGVMAHRAHRSELLTLTVLLNPGMWLSVQLLTSDALSVAAMLGALLFVSTERNRESTGLFSLSVLAKDVSLATPVPLGMDRRDWRMVLVPGAVLAIWMTWLSIQFGDGFASRGNLDWPFLGIVEASSNWATFEAKEWVFLVFALGSVVVGAWASFRASWLRWPIATWTTLAIVSSNWVWDFGNNAARAFAPIVILAALSFAYAGARADTTEKTPLSGT